MTTELSNTHPSSLFSYHQIPLDDIEEADIYSTFMDAFKYIDQCRDNKGRILIHCHQGISRSATIVLGYLMYASKIPLKAAYDIVRIHRKQIFPNPGFW